MNTWMSSVRVHLQVYVYFPTWGGSLLFWWTPLSLWLSWSTDFLERPIRSSSLEKRVWSAVAADQRTEMTLEVWKLNILQILNSFSNRLVLKADLERLWNRLFPHFNARPVWPSSMALWRSSAATSRKYGWDLSFLTDNMTQKNQGSNVHK